MDLSDTALKRFENYQKRYNRGFEPVPHAAQLRKWFYENPNRFSSIMECDLKSCSKIIYDLSGKNDINISGIDDNELLHNTEIMFQKLDNIKASIGIGRYRENRICYQSDQYKVVNEARSQHLGIDLFAKAGTKIFAPMNGIIHSFNNNDQSLDYGPTIILEHRPQFNIHFYTLYGHMSYESLEDLYIGKKIQKNSLIGKIGNFSINGGWIPHLHFQIIFDLLDQTGNYFGVVQPSQWNIWTSICPNPNLILQIPENIIAI